MDRYGKAMIFFCELIRSIVSSDSMLGEINMNGKLWIEEQVKDRV